VASAGLYASLHIAPDRQPRQYPTTLFFTGRMPFLPPNQQRRSTEGSHHQTAKLVATPLRVAGVTTGLAESNGSLPPGL